MYYLKCNPRSFYHKKAFFCEKVYRFFGLALQVFYQFFKSRKSQITWVTQMRKIYIYYLLLQRILFQLASWFALQDSVRSTNGFQSLRKLNILN